MELRFAAHGGGGWRVEEGCYADLRDCAARMIRVLRDEGQIVSTLKRGFEWESTEPDDAAVIPQYSGVLYIA
jgi:hypothetical protein